MVSSVAIPDGTIIPARPDLPASAARELGENRVGVDVATAAQRKPAAVAHELALPFRAVDAPSPIPLASSGFCSGSSFISFSRAALLAACAMSGSRLAKNSFS